MSIICSVFCILLWAILGRSFALWGVGYSCLEAQLWLRIRELNILVCQALAGVSGTARGWPGIFLHRFPVNIARSFYMLAQCSKMVDLEKANPMRISENVMLARTMWTRIHGMSEPSISLRGTTPGHKSEEAQFMRRHQVLDCLSFPFRISLYPLYFIPSKCKPLMSYY